MIAITKALAIMVGKEVLEFVVVDSTLRLIGQGAKRRSTPMTISFDAIRNVVSQNKGAQVIAPVIVATNKVVEAAKVAKSAVVGVLPVSNNQHNHDLEAVLRMVVQNQMLTEQLYATLNIAKPHIEAKDVSDVAEMLLAAIHAKPEKKEELATAPTVASEASVQPDPSASASDPAQPAMEPSSAPNPMQLNMSQPSNWHQQ